MHNIKQYYMLQLCTAFITVWSGTSFLGDGTDPKDGRQYYTHKVGCFVFFLKKDVPDLDPDSVYAFSQYRNGFISWKWMNKAYVLY